MITTAALPPPPDSDAVELEACASCKRPRRRRVEGFIVRHHCAIQQATNSGYRAMRASRRREGEIGAWGAGGSSVATAAGMAATALAFALAVPTERPSLLHTMCVCCHRRVSRPGHSSSFAASSCLRETEQCIERFRACPPRRRRAHSAPRSPNAIPRPDLAWN